MNMIAVHRERIVSMDEEWIEVGCVEEIPSRGSRLVKTEFGDIAVFRTMDDMVFALDDRCPHSGGPLSQGIVHGHAVTCPLHNWRISLESGEAQGEDSGCARRIAVRLRGDRIELSRADMLKMGD